MVPGGGTQGRGGAEGGRRSLMRVLTGIVQTACAEPKYLKWRKHIARYFNTGTLKEMAQASRLCPQPPLQEISRLCHQYPLMPMILINSVPNTITPTLKLPDNFPIYTISFRDELSIFHSFRTPFYFN